MATTRLLTIGIALLLSGAGAPALAQEAANPFTNDGAISTGEPPRARLKPEAVRIVVSAADCRRLIPHEPSPDVTYQPGVDAHGDPVAPADLPGSTVLADRLRETEIAFDLTLNPLLFAGNQRLAEDFDEAVVDFGRVRFDRRTGALTLDGETLRDPATAAIADACRARLSDTE
ncbi:hypothetical protein KAJ83_00875 [Marivibrio halodurans]|uniref:Uncharacterized protein n=1 Tax=Marivibrio halodurans TaxID=2039722 RepID=A0A8J7V2A1_9PROT|nr:hypothetical protein [Marivibrio halodurans]MBP5855544.1 hypothetical protein [Marivibrio halodurans]